VALLDFNGDYGSDVRPPRTAVGRKPWAKDPSGPVSNDGTRLDATILNDLVGLIRATLAAFSVVASAGDDTALAKAITVAIGVSTSGFAPLDSPELTGIPLAPTADPGTNSTQLATTAFVAAAVSAVVNSSPAALDTLKELADALGDDPNFATTITTLIGTKLAKASNLSDLANVATARTNLGLNSAVLRAAGTLAGQVLLLAVDNKLPALDGSALTNLPSSPVASVAGLTGAIAAAALKTALSLVKADVGLANVDNTSDANKPVSTAQQTALNAKMGAPDVIIQEQQASGTNGGSFNSGARVARNLNTLVRNSGSLAFLSSKQFTLPAGSYFIEWGATGYACTTHKAFLRNVTDAADADIGTSAKSPSTYPSNTLSDGACFLSIAASKTFQIEHQCNVSESNDGFGIASGLGTEIYSYVRIWKLS
jgi:hypothetical protein